jgi:hypothetical protein
MQHDELTESMWLGLKLKRDVENLCRIGYDWIEKEPDVASPHGKFYKNKVSSNCCDTLSIIGRLRAQKLGFLSLLRMR